MKLILKRMDGGTNGGLLALHTEDGVALPAQAKITIENEPGAGWPRVIVEFYADGQSLLIQGDQEPKPDVKTSGIGDPLAKHRPLDQVD